jgi:hypothetical protein
MFCRHFQTHNQVFKVQNGPYLSKNAPCTSYLPENQVFQNVIQFFSKTNPNTLYTFLHIFKSLKCKMFQNFLWMFHLPATFQKIQGFKKWSDFVQNHSKCFVYTSLYMIKCLKCKMFHNFLGMFHWPAIFPKISLKMWSDYFQNHSQCFVDISLHIIKCIKCKMFHNFHWMFQLPPIFP